MTFLFIVLMNGNIIIKDFNSFNSCQAAQLILRNSPVTHEVFCIKDLD